MNSLNQRIAKALTELQKLYPHWRFGQLVENVAAWAGKDAPASVGDVSDEAFLLAAESHLERRRQEQGGQRAKVG